MSVVSDVPEEDDDKPTPPPPVKTATFFRGDGEADNEDTEG
jgi:hypothetical protein